MFQRKTLFVVGAGASVGANLPTGDALRKIISEKLDIYIDAGRIVRGDSALWDSLNGWAQYKKIPENLRGTCLAIRDVMRNQTPISIDAWLDTHSDDPLIQRVGKLAIVRSILEGEARSPLKLDRQFNNPEPASRVAGQWYTAFAQLALDGVRLGRLNDALSKISIINFNYDRCIEQYLIYAISPHFRISQEEAAKALAGLQIIHPYGSAGRLPWQSHLNQSVLNDFGEDCVGQNLIDTSEGILTYTEQIQDGVVLADIRKAVAGAQTAIFLGFGFHPQNMKLLSSDGRSDVERVFATTFGVSDTDWLVVQDAIDRMFGRNDRTLNPRRAERCEDLFSRSWHELRAN